MKIIQCPAPGKVKLGTGVRISNVELPDVVKETLIEYYGDLELFPPQLECLKKNFLNSDGNFVISTPTNSGKTLIGIFAMLSEVIKGRRVIYVTPMKSIAEEKLLEFEELTSILSRKLGKRIKTVIMTGDHEISWEYINSEPKAGEMIISTPERLDSIMRNPKNSRWFKYVSTCIIDEVHLLDDVERGPNLEGSLTRLMIHYPHIRIITLSATIGNVKELSAWLNAKSYTSNWRYPPLRKTIVVCNNKLKTILKKVKEILTENNENRVLIFVWSPPARKKCQEIALELKKVTQGFVKEREVLQQASRNIENNSLRSVLPFGCAFYHSGLSLNDRKIVQREFRRGNILAVVSTAALELGVNFPVSHVIIKDVFRYVPKGRIMEPLSVNDILQMSGRSGRRLKDKFGNVIILISEGEERIEEKLNTIKEKVCKEIPEAITPKLFLCRSKSVEDCRSCEEYMECDLKRYVETIYQKRLAQILAEISILGKTNEKELINKFVRHTFSSFGKLYCLQDEIYDLKDLDLVKEENGSLVVTEIGRLANVLYIQPLSTYRIYSFLNDIKAIGLSASLSRLDILFLASTLPEIQSFAHLYISKEAKKERKLLSGIEMREIYSKVKKHQTVVGNFIDDEENRERLLGTLAFENSELLGDKNSLRIILFFFKIAFSLFDYMRGKSVSEVCKKYGIEVGDFQTRIKPAFEWLLHSIRLITAKVHSWKLANKLVWPLVLSLRYNYPVWTFTTEMYDFLETKGIGVKSIEKLIEKGYDTKAKIKGLSLNELQRIIGRKDIAQKIHEIALKQ